MTKTYGNNIKKSLDKYNNLINKSIITSPPSEDEVFTICNFEIGFAESIIKDFGEDFADKLGRILIAASYKPIECKCEYSKRSTMF